MSVMSLFVRTSKEKFVSHSTYRILILMSQYSTVVETRMIYNDNEKFHQHG